MKKQMMIFAQNLVLKINVKCGGQNFQLSPKLIRDKVPLLKEDSNTMLLGADVTHGVPSIAAVVATTDSRALNYACRMKALNPKEEIIVHMQEMVEELLDVYKGNTKKFPSHIILFRDGVGESLFLDVVRQEGPAILKAAQAKYPTGTDQPKVFIILAVSSYLLFNDLGSWIMAFLSFHVRMFSCEITCTRIYCIVTKFA